LVLAGFGVVALFGGTEIEVNERVIQYKTALSLSEMRWSEIVRIETDTMGLVLGFIGEGRQLVAPGPYSWNKKEGMPMITFILSQCEKRQMSLCIGLCKRSGLNIRQPFAKNNRKTIQGGLPILH
jgi:hypothetical protein